MMGVARGPSISFPYMAFRPSKLPVFANTFRLPRGGAQMPTSPDSWPRRHWRHAWLLGLLVFTGLGLFLPAWRSAAGPLLPWVQAVHDGGGILYGLALIGWSARFFPWPPTPKGFAGWAYFFAVGLAVTGLGLLVGPSWTHALATVGHAAFAACLVVWAAWHLIQQVPRRLGPLVGQPSTSSGVWGATVTRRRFLRWAGASLAAIPALLALPDLGRVATGPLDSTASSAQGALPGFIPYTVIDGFPRLDATTYRLALTAGGRLLRTFALAELQTFPTQQRVYTFHCVTGWAVTGLRIEGVNLERWLLAHGWNPSQHPWVLFFSGDGVYTESLSAKQIHKYQPLLTWAMDGRPLAVSQGYPLRLMVPGMYGYKSIKWLVRIELADRDHLGFWEVRGYPQDAYLGSYQPF
jgi:hypothetical protein